MIGKQLGHYRIEAKLGEGGMGIVYKARDLHLDRPVAIKLLSAEAVSDPERNRRFVQEARTASALNHPNIIHIYDIDRSDGMDFMAMEFVEGKTLDQIGHEGLPLVKALAYAGQVAGALARAHEAGIVHRDIKPANIMVTGDGLVKVLDFGLAKLTEPVDTTTDPAITRTVHPRTEPGVVFGTVQYMSPEQAEGKSVDARSDIFSFGTVLYEMLSGRRPFQGDSKLRILSAVLTEDPGPLRELPKGVQPGLNEIVSRCLEKQPERRFQNMHEVKAALDAVLEEVRRPSMASGPRRVPAAVWRASRRKWLWVWAAVVAAATLAVLVTLARRGSGAGNKASLVAVLPFQSAAADPATQAFSAGLAETLSRQLGGLNQFQRAKRVLPPEDVHGDAASGPLQAQKKLGVDQVLTGTLQGTWPGMRLALSLADATTGGEVQHVEMDLPRSDSSGLVREVARVLDLRWTGQAEGLMGMGRTANPAAYEDYLQAWGYLSHSDRADDLERSIGLFREALKKDPSYGLAHAGLGEALWAKSSLTQDRQWAEQARASCLRAIAGKADIAAVHLILGKIYSGTGRPQEAVEEFRKAIQLDRLNIEGHTNLGEAYEALGQLSDAEGAYRGLVALWPNYLIPYSHLASFYVRQGRYQDAEPVFRKVIELVPENSTGYQNLGAVYHLLGRSDEAAAMMKKSLSIKPSARVYTNLGTLYFFEGRYSDAVPLMEKAVEMDGTNYVYRGNLGDAYRWAPEYKERAAEAYRQAIKLAEQQPNLNPNDAEVRSNLAAYYAKLPDRAKALAEIAQARRLAPMNPEVLFKAALVYEITGKREQAISALDLALQSGYSIDEVRRDPELAGLRTDARYLRLEKGTRKKSP